MKKYFLLSLLGLTSVSAVAQKKNRIEIGMFRYQFAGAQQQSSCSPFLNLTVPSISYERMIGPRFGVFVQYVGIPDNSNIDYVSREEVSEKTIGKATHRSSLNYADLGATYKLLQPGRRHQLTLRAGISKAWGSSVYITSYDPIPRPWDWEWGPATADFRQERFFGALAGIRYDYSFWKNRLNAGLNFDARHYAGGFPFQVNYGAHLGFNF